MSRVGVGNQSVPEPHGEGFPCEPLNDSILVKPPKVGFFWGLKINQLYCKIVLVVGARVLQDACMSITPMTNIDIKKLTKIETVPCDRCAGTGQHSNCEVFGTTCFKCNGSGRKYTKRGAVVVQYFESLKMKSVKASDIKIGDRVKMCSYVFTVKEITNPHDKRYINFHSQFGVHGAFVNSDIEVFTGMTDAECLAKALEFQATLTKSGKPIKN